MLAEMTPESRIGTENSNNVIETAVHGRNRVIEAQLHFNDRDPRARMVKQLFTLLVTTYGQVAQEIVLAIREGLQVAFDEKGKVARAVLSIVCANSEDERAADDLLARKPEEGKLYTNSYRLIGKRTEKERVWLDFELARAQEKRGLAKLPGTFLQMVIIRWLRPAGLTLLPRTLHQGVAQEVAQVILSHIELLEKGQPGKTSLPDFSRCNEAWLEQDWQEKLLALSLHAGELKQKPLRQVLRRRFSPDDPHGDEMIVTDPLWTECKPVTYKPLAMRFVASTANKICLRVEPSGQTRLYLATPFGDWFEQNGASETNLYWWRSRLSEFQFLPPWQEEKLTARSKCLLIPLSVQGGQRRLKRYRHDLESREHGRFVRALANPDWHVAWSMLVQRQADFFVQLTLAREQEVISRPNLVGIHFAQEETATHFQFVIYWSWLEMGTTTPAQSGRLITDTLPKDGRWPSRQERKRRAYAIAREVAKLADSLNADLALEEVTCVKKRGRDGQANRVATRFNFSQLASFIRDKGLDHQPAVTVVAWVSDYHLREERTKTHTEQAKIIVRQGEQIRQKIREKRAKARKT